MIKERKMNIPIVDVKRQLKSIREEINEAVTEVLDSGYYIFGPAVKKFESETCDYLGAAHGIGCASGTDALMLALMGMGIKPGDEVITTPFTFVATIEVIALLGAVPVFVDIDSDTFNIDVNKIEDAVTDKTKAIMPVHLFGRCAEMDGINEIAKKHNLITIEDSAQAFGAEYNGKKAGALGDIGCFSFYPTKNLNAFGDGGLVTTNDDSLAEEIRVCASHGSKEKYKAAIIGVNSRLDAIQAACLSVKLKYIDKWNASRIEKAQTYNALLADTGIVIPSGDTLKKSVFHQYSILVKNRDKLQEYLKSKGISTMIYYPIPLHLQEAYSYLNYKKGDFPVTEKAAEDIISLPMFPELTTEEIKIITNEIKTFLNVALPL